LRTNIALPKIKKTDFQAKALIVEGSHKLRPNKLKKNDPKRFFENVAISRMTISLKVIVIIKKAILGM